MIRPGSGHLDDGALLGYLGGDLARWRAAATRQHLGGCELCRARTEELRNVVSEFSTYWESRKALSPSAPADWEEIEFEMQLRELSQPVHRTNSRRLWLVGIALAAAAAPLWIAGSRMHESAPEPVRAAHFAPVPAGSLPQMMMAPPGISRSQTAKAEQGNLQLEAIAALHRIGADVSEPVELRGSAEGLEVVATAVDAAREREIRDALSPYPAIQLRFTHPERQALALEPREANAAGLEGPSLIRAKLDEALGPAAREEMEGRALEQSARLLARLHAIDELDRRFPPDVRKDFSAEESYVLEQIRTDHIGKAKESMADLQAVFESIGTVWGVTSSASALSGGLLENARRLDEAVGVLLGGAPTRRAPADLMAAATASLSRLRRELETMR